MKFILYIILLFNILITNAFSLPSGLVYLEDVDPTIEQDIRYAGYHNFIGRPIAGYKAAECILTLPTAKALAEVQKELQKSGLSLKVYDCYRPQEASEDFMSWAHSNDYKMKAEFYPHIHKKNIFKLGYIAGHSGHSRGSTVDLTIVFPCVKSNHYHPGQILSSCGGEYKQRYFDNSIDMGTGYDCMHPLSNLNNKEINIVAQFNRALLSTLMQKYGFSPYSNEWWHFTYKNEPFPNTYFNFPIVKKS